MSEKQIILASGSPRRQAILRQLNIHFHVHPSPQPELIGDNETPEAAALRLALEKAVAVQKFYLKECILAADTIVAVNGHILGKPKNASDAVSMLLQLQGRWHEVTTGVALLGGKKKASGVEKTRVLMRALAIDEIHAYVKNGEPMDKAGAYAIQGLGASFIEKIEGCFYNVVGLPIALTIRLLREAGFSVPNYAPSEKH